MRKSRNIYQSCGGALARLEFGSSVNPIPTASTPGFKNLATSLFIVHMYFITEILNNDQILETQSLTQLL